MTQLVSSLRWHENRPLTGDWETGVLRMVLYHMLTENMLGYHLVNRFITSFLLLGVGAINNLLQTSAFIAINFYSDCSPSNKTELVCKKWAVLFYFLFFLFPLRNENDKKWNSSELDKDVYMIFHFFFLFCAQVGNTIFYFLLISLAKSDPKSKVKIEMAKWGSC